jgi:hypothetical protein
MLPRGGRALAIVAAILLAPVLASSFALASAVHDHECSFDKQCLTCRWAADTVAEVGPPPTTAAPPEPAGAAPTAGVLRPLLSDARAASSRGPPPSA